MLNSCSFIGNVGKTPEIKTLNSGSKVANFSIAVTEKWKKDGEAQERTEWVNIVVWNEGLVGVVEKYVHKGSKIYVSGKMQTRKWQDNSGADRWSNEIVLNGFDAKIVLLGDPKGEGDRSSGGSAYDAGEERTSRGSRSTLAEDEVGEVPFLSMGGLR